MLMEYAMLVAVKRALRVLHWYIKRIKRLILNCIYSAMMSFDNLYYVFYCLITVILNNLHFKRVIIHSFMAWKIHYIIHF